MTFPNQLTVQATSTCTFQFGFSGVPACSISGNVVKITNGFPNLKGIRFMVSNVKNPGSAQQVSGFSVKFYSTLTATSTLDASAAGAFYQAYTPDTLSSAVILPGSYIVGDVVTWNFNIIPKNPIPVGGLIQISFPKWTDATRYSIGAQSMLSPGTNLCSPISGLTATSLSCTFTINANPSGLDTLLISGAFQAVQTAGSVFEISVDSVKNMPTTRSYTTFAILTLDASQYGIDAQSGMTMAMLTPGTLASSQVTVIINPPTTVDAITSYLFTLFVSNPIPEGGNIEVIIPPTITASGLLSSIGADQRINSAVTVAPVNPAFPNDVMLTGGFPTLSDSVPIQGLIAFTMKYLQNPSTNSPTTSFQIITYDDIYPIEQITTGLIVVGQTGSITMSTFTYSDSRVLEYNAFTISMTLQSALQSSCSIQVTFPAEFTIPNVATTSCTLSGTSGLSPSYKCSIVANKLTISTPFGSATSALNTNVQFTIANNYVQNPSSTKPTATAFTVQTVSQNGSPIDTWTGSQFTATVNSLKTASVTASSYQTGAQDTVFTFSLTTPHLVAANAYILISPPSNDIQIFDSSVVQGSITALQTVVQSYITCSISSGDIYVKGGFYNSLCPCTGTIQFSVGGFLNPRSMATTSSFTLKIQTYDNYPIYYMQTGITLTMTKPNTYTNMTLKA